MNIVKNYFKKRNSIENEKLDTLVTKKNEISFKIINQMLDYYFNNKIQAESKFLDIGQGNGSFVKHLVNKKINAYGCDINDSNFESEPLNYENDEFDFAMMYSVIEHINNTDNILKEARRILKTNGNLIIITPNFKYNYQNFYDDPTHIKPFTDTGLKSILEIYNFKDIIIKPWTSFNLKFIWKIPFSFYFCAKILKLRGDNKFPFINFLKGKSEIMIAICKKN